MLLFAAVLLGAIPSFGNAFIAAAVGYITEATNDPSAFLKILSCLYFSSALVSWLQGRFDSTFDARFPAKQVQGFRIFFPALVLILAYVCVGAFAGLSRRFESSSSLAISILALTAIIGFSSGSLLGSGSVLMEGVGTREQVLVWIGISSAGLLCIATVWITGFTPQASPSTISMFYFSGAGLLAACAVALVAMHLSGMLDMAYERAVDLEGIVMTPGSNANQVPFPSWIIGANAGMTVFLGPTLPFLCYTLLAQHLILWKLSMDFLGPLLLLALPNRCSTRVLLALLVIRILLLALVLLLFLSYFGSKACNTAKIAWLVISWDVYMFLGALISCFCDTWAGGLEAPRIRSSHRIRWNRFLYHAGICLGLVCGAALIYGFLLDRHAGEAHPSNFIASCARCVDPDSGLGGLQRNPCGTPSDEEGSVRVFHYGANMGCAKLGAIGVKPRSAEAAYIPGKCLQFGAGTGVPTSPTEPAFGSITPCAEGCVHGVVHDVPKSELDKIHATESGYDFALVSGVIGYDGQPISDVHAYMMRANFTRRAPSRRYAGLVFCQAKSSLSAEYGQQLSCQFGELGIESLDCDDEEFRPLNASTL